MDELILSEEFPSEKFEEELNENQERILTPEEIKAARYARLNKIFTKAERGIRKLGIDKDYLNTDAAINAQLSVYETMYQNALKGLYDTDTNNAIIAANENAKALLAPIVLLMNNVRSLIAYKIETDADDVDTFMDIAASVKLDKSELTSEKLEELKSIFGLS
jgi:hypothetical protein